MGSLVYRQQGDGVPLYEGELVLRTAGQDVKTNGLLELQLTHKAQVIAHVHGPEVVALHDVERSHQVSIPGGASLEPPASGEEDAGVPLALGQPITAGDPAACTRLVIHVVGPLRVDLTGAVGFRLPGWSLRLDHVVDATFSYVVEATPDDAVTAEDADELVSRLAALFSFVACWDVGVYPYCGLDDSGRVCWIVLAPPRFRPGSAGIRWTSAPEAADALVALAEGMTTLAQDDAADQIVRRAVALLTPAHGTEVVEVRVLTACAALELLSWAVLQWEGWFTELGELNDLSAAARLRLLLQWAGIDPVLNASLHDLRDWATDGAGGPEAIVQVRNRILHPAQKAKWLRDPQWPPGAVVVDAWHLAVEYAELVLLRLLGFNGKYGTRLGPRRAERDLKPVPWAPEAAGT
ncbi:hypothetical protein [Euzebya sp.]|uniref:hypothetical protein n=1 Tax=Euzebya sp. TaxID=1971409 RepID=UPI003519676A